MKTTFHLIDLCIELTNACPLNCLICSGNCGFKGVDYLPFEKIREIITEFAEMGGTTLELSGGEPLLHPAILSIIAFAKSKKLHTTLCTSGNTTNNPQLPISHSLAKDLECAGLGKIIFSLHGASSTTHDKVTGVPGSYSNTIESIRSLKSTTIPIGVHFVPTNLNFQELDKLQELSKHLGVETLAVLRFVPQGRGSVNKKDLDLSASALNELKLLILKEVNTPNSIIHVGRPFGLLFKGESIYKKEDCDAGVSRCLITPDGRVVPCPAFKSNSVSWTTMGNILNKSLVEIWNDSSKWANIRSFNCDNIDEPCESCHDCQACKGGCKAQRLLKYDSLYGAPDPICNKRSVSIPKTVSHPSNAKCQLR